tara:strand:- start:72155 stop:72283 length:129 start_codon:yes stop_codon:yes gene_type:complete
MIKNDNRKPEKREESLKNDSKFFRIPLTNNKKQGFLSQIIPK